MDISVVVLVGGLGTRVREVSGGLPKPMMPVAGRPFLEHVLRYLALSGIRRIVLATGYKAELVEEHFGDGVALGLHVTYSCEDEPLGTGGALSKACECVGDWPVLALNGDSFLEVDLPAMLAFHTAHGKPLSVALAHVKDTGRFGRVRLDSTGGIVAFEEKTSAGPGLVNGGVYLMEREVQLRIPVQKCSFERDVLPSLLGGGAVGFVTSGFFVDIGVPADYRRLVRSPGTFLRAIGGRQR